MKILAASKGRSDEEIKRVHKEGITLFGENYIQEAEKKIDLFKSLGVEIHLIGKLQKNKINKALQIFDCIQTIDSFELVKLINQKTNKIVKIMVQVNLAEEKQKNGCLVKDLDNLVKKIKEMKNINLTGLMFLGTKENNSEYFKKMKNLQEKYKLKELSMGMSKDYQEAIDNGATMIRLGRKLFDSKV